MLSVGGVMAMKVPMVAVVVKLVVETRLVVVVVVVVVVVEGNPLLMWICGTI